MGRYAQGTYPNYFRETWRLNATRTAFSTLRVFALCERPYKWPVSMAVLVLSSVIVVMNYVRPRFYDHK